MVLLPYFLQDKFPIVYEIFINRELVSYTIVAPSSNFHTQRSLKMLLLPHA